MNKLWTIVKGVITFITFTGIVAAGVMFFNLVNDTADTLNNDVIPKLDQVIDADSASKARDVIIEEKLDHTNEVVNFLATEYVENALDNPGITHREFVEQIGILKEYLDDIKKNSEPEVLPIDTMQLDYWKHPFKIPSDWWTPLNTVSK